jgi:hypothetical protein
MHHLDPTDVFTTFPLRDQSPNFQIEKYLIFELSSQNLYLLEDLIRLIFKFNQSNLLITIHSECSLFELKLHLDPTSQFSIANLDWEAQMEYITEKIESTLYSHLIVGQGLEMIA